MSKDYHYSFICGPSAEARGRRVGLNEGCLRKVSMSTARELSEDIKIQSSPCPHCGKRTRLNQGNTTLWYSREDADYDAFEYNRTIHAAMQRLETE